MFRTVQLQPLMPVAGGAVILIFAVRLITTALALNRIPIETRGGLMALWFVDTALNTTIVIAAVAGCGWMTARIRRREREQARTEHLAEVGVLAGGLTHEIRNALNAMHSQIALLRKQLPQEAGDACKRTGQLEQAVTELEGLVGEFLAFARPTKDQLEQVSVPGLIGDLLDFIGLDLEQAGVMTVAQIEPDLPHIYVDACKLKRALLNLIINARQAMAEGGMLTVNAARVGPDEVVVEVRDTGCGIPEEDQPYIFQSFFSTKPEGTGLGLAVVKRTVEDFGGRVTFFSEPGHGTTFRISLPTAERRQASLKRQGQQGALQQLEVAV